jgi:mRNA-degrading endonuclease toxin of MazEF toxin-antitoxin module
VVLDIRVSNDQLVVVLGNQGEGTVPASQELELRLRGVAAETVTLSQALPPGASVPILLEDQVIYRSEVVLAVVDPNNVIPEEDDDNNGLAKPLAPDVALDLGVHGVFRSTDTNRLLVVIENPTRAPAIQVTVVVAVTVNVGGATETTTRSSYQLTIEPLGFETVEVPGVVAVPGVQMRVRVGMTDPPDADPSNNVWQGIISP